MTDRKSKNCSNCQPLDPSIESLIARIRGANLTYCGRPKLENLARAASRVVKEQIPGVFIEAGVALGGSAIVLGHIKPLDTSLELYDVYGMIPPPSENDGSDSHARYSEIKSGASKGLGLDLYYGYKDDLMAEVRNNLSGFNLDVESHHIKLIRGLFDDTLWPKRVALAHIDCDWYDSVKVCIERIWPRLSYGGIMVFDDYSSYAGCGRVIDSWLREELDSEVIFCERSIGIRRRSSLRSRIRAVSRRLQRLSAHRPNNSMLSVATRTQTVACGVPT